MTRDTVGVGKQREGQGFGVWSSCGSYEKVEKANKA